MRAYEFQENAQESLSAVDDSLGACGRIDGSVPARAAFSVLTYGMARMADQNHSHSSSGVDRLGAVRFVEADRA